jgi:hypothetical protein
VDGGHAGERKRGIDLNRDPPSWLDAFLFLVQLGLFLVSPTTLPPNPNLRLSNIFHIM